MSIPIVALGVYKQVAASMDPLFTSTPFRMAAILDLASEPVTYQYNPYNLAVLLHNLHPKPQVFITGAAISEEMTAESIAVWEEYVQDLGVTENLVINVCAAKRSCSKCLKKDMLTIR